MRGMKRETERLRRSNPNYNEVTDEYKGNFGAMRMVDVVVSKLWAHKLG